MKNLIFILKIIIITASVAFSQDVITKKSGEDIQAKILEVSTSEVKYKKYDNLEGPTYVIPLSDVLILRYDNGTKDIIIEENKNETEIVATKQPTIDLYSKGQVDAIRFYDGYSTAGTVTLITGLLSPLIGLAPAIGCSVTKPKDINLDYPNAELMGKREYYLGYTKEARKIKNRKVWLNWSISFGVNLVLLYLLL